MIKQAKKNLKSFDNVEIIHSSFTDVKLPRKVDVIFSNAALHWVLDHRKAFQNFWAMLKPMKDSSGNNDSQLLIQCGGYGNLQQTITLLERIAHSYSFKAYFANWKQSWYFAKSEDTDKLLEEIGYTDRTTYLQHLPVNKDGCKLKTLFLDLFLDEIKKSVNRLKTRWFLDYVRLNIISYRES